MANHVRDHYCGGLISICMHSHNAQRSGSPSLDDLRRQQEQLLAALDDSTSTASVPAAVPITNTADDSLIDDIMALDADADSTLNTTADCTLNTTADCTPDAGDSAPSTPLNSSIHSVSGTPLLQSTSPFTQLPNGSNWSVGVSDIIDFENLADTAGKFQRMKGLIDKVRVAVKQLQDDYDD